MANVLLFISFIYTIGLGFQATTVRGLSAIAYLVQTIVGGIITCVIMLITLSVVRAVLRRENMDEFDTHIEFLQIFVFCFLSVSVLSAVSMIMVIITVFVFIILNVCTVILSFIVIGKSQKKHNNKEKEHIYEKKHFSED